MEKSQQNNNNDGSLKGQLFDNLRKLINVVDELRDVGLQQHIQLPRICVIGSQSSGKSSLLENVVGLDFLPRGSGVVTRLPLELRLIHVPLSSGAIKPWAVFDNDKNKKYTDFDLVRQNIEKLTDDIAGKNKGIKTDAIKMKIFSNDCPDLTLVDLPGITRIPLAGSDQKQDIEAITREMCEFYAKDERTIILCVIPANADISTSDGLSLAKRIDPEGIRTLGVLTKIDIMDKGTDARKMLMGGDVNLRLGYVGVVNRSQQDIQNKVRVQMALEEERKFFACSPVYSTMDPKLLGTKSLVQNLTNIFFGHIKKTLPIIQNEIKEKVNDCEERLKELGPALPTDNKDKMHIIWERITEFTENFKNAISGKYDAKRQTNLKQEISGGAVIKMMFNDLYEENVKHAATEEYTDKDIDRSITLHQGDNIPGFPSIDAFLYLINPQLEKLKEPAHECLTSVYNYLENLSTKLLKQVFIQFPSIIDEIGELSSRVLQQCRDQAKQIVDNVIESEQGYLFTNDLEYLQHKTALIPKKESEKPVIVQQGQQGQQQIQPSQQNVQENSAKQAQKDLEEAKKAFIKELRSRVDVYYSLVLRNVRDSVPKAIGYFLVKQSQEQMQYTLYNEMLQKESSLEILQEPPIIREERATVTKTLNVLKQAQKVLKRDPDLSSSSV